MQGPIAAIRFFDSLPFFIKYFMTALIIPLKAPFHPACTAEIILSFLSNINIGTQSAVKTPSIIFLLLVITFFLNKSYSACKESIFFWKFQHQILIYFDCLWIVPLFDMNFCKCLSYKFIVVY